MTPQQLKNSILQLAVQGKLVKQDPNDEPVSLLLTRIKEKKEELIKDGKIKRDKQESIIFRRDNSYYEKVGSKAVCIDNEILFDVPYYWGLIRLDDIGIYRKGPFGSSLTKGMFVPKGMDTVKVYEQKNAIQKDHTLGAYYITREYYETKMRSFTVEPGDIIVSCAGTIGETYVMPKQIELGIINQALMRMTIYAPIDLDYFLFYFDYVLKQTAKESSKGSAIKNIPPFEIFKKLIFPLPPIEEQKRIVAKIEELMPLVEQYEVAYNKLENLNKKFPEDMQKAILQYAVQGKLVEQRPEEGTGEGLYKQIQAEKQRLIKEGKIKKEKPLEEIKEDEIPFDIPDSWKWVRLTDIASSELGKTKDSLRNKGFLREYLCSINVCDNFIDLSTVKKMRFEDEEIERYSVQKDDLLVCEGGDAGRSALWDKDFKMCYQNAIHRIRFIFKIEPKFYLFVFKTYKANGIFKSASRGETIQHLTANALKSLTYPFPPIAEQKRIVAKIEELMPLVELLKRETLY